MSPSVPVASLFPRLEAKLSSVQKPIQYVGGELNSVHKDWDDVDVRWCLMYPDAYEVGLPNQGIAILYEVLNERDWILAERTYAVWADLEALMREHRIPQFTLDSHRPVAAFDVLDPEEFPAAVPAPGGLSSDKLYDLMEAVAEDSELVGLEITAFEAPEDEDARADMAETAMRVLDPLLDRLSR